MGGSISVRNDSSVVVDVSICLFNVYATKRCRPGEIITFETSVMWYTLKAIPVGQDITTAPRYVKAGPENSTVIGTLLKQAYGFRTITQTTHLNHTISLVDPAEISSDIGPQPRHLVPGAGHPWSPTEAYAIESSADPAVFTHPSGNYKVLKGFNDDNSELYKLSFTVGKYGEWP